MVGGKKRLSDMREGQRRGQEEWEGREDAWHTTSLPPSGGLDSANKRPCSTACPVQCGYSSVTGSILGHNQPVAS